MGNRLLHLWLVFFCLCNWTQAPQKRNKLLILTAGGVIEKINKENKNSVVNYIFSIVRFATQTFNGGKKAVHQHRVITCFEAPR